MASLVVLESIRPGEFQSNLVAKWLERPSSQPPSTAEDFSPQDCVLLYRLRHRGRMSLFEQAIVELLAPHVLQGAITPILLKKCLRTVHAHFLADVLLLREDKAVLFDIERMKRLDVFLRGRTLSWETIGKTGAQLRCRGGVWPDADDYFEFIGGLMLNGPYLKLELGLGSGPPRPQFCDFCWRFKMTSSKYCSLHSPSNAPQHQVQPPSDAYRFSRRLQPTFVSWQKRLQRDDRKLKLRSEWGRAVDENTTCEWLSLRRPRVYEWLLRTAGVVGGVSEIIDSLNRVDGESTQEMILRGNFHQRLRRDGAAVFTMISRAEAWMCAASERSSKWGGPRKGAGRKPACPQVI